MRIQTRLKKLESTITKEGFKPVIGTHEEITDFLAMDDETFLKKTGIDRNFYDVIYIIDSF